MSLISELGGEVATVEDVKTNGYDVIVSTVPPTANLSSILNKAIIEEYRPVIFDVVYTKSTLLVEYGKESDCYVVRGQDMLVEQGSVAFSLWTKRLPNQTRMLAAIQEGT